MAKRHRWESRSRDATNHPIAWFSTPLRGIARNDKTMVEQPRAKTGGTWLLCGPQAIR